MQKKVWHHSVPCNHALNGTTGSQVTTTLWFVPALIYGMALDVGLFVSKQSDPSNYRSVLAPSGVCCRCMSETWVTWTSSVLPHSLAMRTLRNIYGRAWGSLPGCYNSSSLALEFRTKLGNAMVMSLYRRHTLHHNRQNLIRDRCKSYWRQCQHEISQANTEHPYMKKMY